jgi:hypothetical protein
MSEKLRRVMIDSGIVDEDQLLELQRWRLPAAVGLRPSKDKKEIHTADIVQAIEMQLHSNPHRVTLLDAHHLYSKTQESAMLVMQETANTPYVTADIIVGFYPAVINGVRVNQVLLPWEHEEDISDLLTNGLTHLVVRLGRIFFKDALPVYSGERITFMLCTPSTIEPHVRAIQTSEGKNGTI